HPGAALRAALGRLRRPSHRDRPRRTDPREDRGRPHPPALRRHRLGCWLSLRGKRGERRGSGAAGGRRGQEHPARGGRSVGRRSAMKVVSRFPATLFIRVWLLLAFVVVLVVLQVAVSLVAGLDGWLSLSPDQVDLAREVQGNVARWGDPGWQQQLRP